MGFDFWAIPRWILNAAGAIVPINSENVQVPRLEIDDATTFIDKDGSDNMTFEDAVSGSKKLSDLVGGADAAAIHDNVDAEISAIANKAAPVAGDYIIIEDSEASDAKKHITISQMPAGSHTLGGGQSDVTITSVTDNEVLAYDNGSSEWINQTPDEAGLVGKALFGAYTILAADTNDVPAAIALAASQMIGRKATGGIVALAKADILTIINVTELADVTGSNTCDTPGGADTDTTAIHDNTANEITAIDLKAVPVAADEIVIEDSAASYVKKSIMLGTLPAHAPQAHKDTHDPSGSDPLDAGLPNAILEVQAQAGGTAETWARSDHDHAIVHDITDNSLVTVDGSPNSGEYVVWAAGGIDGKTLAEFHSLIFASALPENVGLILDAALSADEKWSGIVEAGTGGTTLNFGDLVYLAVADSRWELAKADVAATSFAKLGINVTIAQVSDGGAMTVLLYGKVRSDADYAFTVGAPVFVSAATAGDMTSTAPSGTTGFIVRIVGYGNTADELFFCPSPDYFELA